MPTVLSPQPYKKPARSIEEQIVLLVARGMVIDDQDLARDELSKLNYYRLRGYWISFEKTGDTDHAFKEDTHFEDVLSLYRFDEDLRYLLSYYLGKIEVFLRAKFAHYLALECQNPLIYREQDIFDRKYKPGGEDWNYKESLKKLDRGFERSEELFAEKLKEKYQHPPIWAVVEVMSFGQLVRWCRNLRHGLVVKNLVNSFGMQKKRAFRSFLHSSVALRNMCAHQNRLVYRDLRIPPATPSKKSDLRMSWNQESDKLYNLLTLIAYVIPNIDSKCSFKGDLLGLANKHGVSLHVLGFPKDWADRPVWV